MLECGSLATAQYSTPSSTPTLTDKLLMALSPPSLCSWIMDFHTSRPQSVSIGPLSSKTLIMNTGCPQGCVLSPLLYTLLTHDCTASYESNSIIRFADDTTVIGLITGGDETAYRSEVSSWVTWCHKNNLSLNVSKPKEMIVDVRRRNRGHQHQHHQLLHIDGSALVKVGTITFLGVHISEDLTWS